MSAATGIAPSDSIILETRFGKREIARTKLISMPQGLLGFEELQTFALLHIEGDGNGTGPFKLLQSVDDPSVAFFVIPISLHNQLIEAEDLERIALDSGVKPADSGFLIIVTLRRLDGAEMRATGNCQAPIVIDATRRLAWQMVMDNGKYSVQHPL